jgi:peptidyl-tRNA hydrolase
MNKQNITKYKMYVIVDDTVKMPKGKLAREVAGAVTHTIMYHFSHFKWLTLTNWYKQGMKTVVVKTDDISKLEKTLKRKKQMYLSMVDAGKTVFTKPTKTCISLPIIEDPSQL